MRIALITPYGRAFRNGNAHTALRWAHFLRAAGHRVALAEQWDGAEADLMIALHARRSHAAISDFARRHPNRPLVVALTGTDLYRDLAESTEARESLHLAHRLVVLQDKAPEALPQRLVAKARVIYQSAADIPRRPSAQGVFDVLVIGHLREEKDPFRTALASAWLPPRSRTRIVHFGRALDEELAQTARNLQRRLARYTWLGERTHGHILQRLASASLLVVSSLMEGGANVICEALAADTPVLASAVPGNIGMLGENYPGYFPAGDERRLARLISHAEHAPDFYADLLRHGRARRALMRPQNEASRLRQLVGEFEIIDPKR